MSIPSGGYSVMAQKRDRHDHKEDYPTPCWATRALIERVLHPTIAPPSELHRSVCWEPAANRGHMARPLAAYFGKVVASDVHDYGVGFAVRDFLFPFPVTPTARTDWIITNPPFRLGEKFVVRGLGLAKSGVAVLVRLQWLEGRGRFERLFSQRPPLIIAQFTERVPMVKGRLDRSASTATAYAWVVWRIGGTHATPAFMWIPPCRADLDHDSDWRQP